MFMSVLHIVKICWHKLVMHCLRVELRRLHILRHSITPNKYIREVSHCQSKPLFSFFSAREGQASKCYQFQIEPCKLQIMRVRRNGTNFLVSNCIKKSQADFIIYLTERAAPSWRKGLIRTSSKTRLKVHAQYLCETWFKLFHPKLSKVSVTCAQGFWKPE